MNFCLVGLSVKTQYVWGSVITKRTLRLLFIILEYDGGGYVI